MIREMHYAFISSLEHETSSPTQANVMKALTHLIENVPYEKLKSLTVLTTIVRLLLKQVHTQDRTVQNMALHCLAQVFATKEKLPDVQTFLNSTEGNSLMLTLMDLFCDAHSSLVRSDAATVLANMAKTYPQFFISHWSKMLELINNAMFSTDQTLRLAAVHIVLGLTSSSHNELLDTLDKEDTTSTSSAVAQKKDLEDVMTVDMWLSIGKQMQQAFFDSFQTVKATAASIYANIKASTFAQLPVC